MEAESDIDTVHERRNKTTMYILSSSAVGT
jgi:hypothetical protein